MPEDGCSTSATRSQAAHRACSWAALCVQPALLWTLTAVAGWPAWAAAAMVGWCAGFYVYLRYLTDNHRAAAGLMTVLITCGVGVVGASAPLAM